MWTTMTQSRQAGPPQACGNKYGQQARKYTCTHGTDRRSTPKQARRRGRSKHVAACVAAVGGARTHTQLPSRLEI
jgi:hypothetical protein